MDASVEVYPAQVIEPAPTQQVDPLLYRIVIYFLGAISLVAVGGILALAILGKDIPDAMTAIGSLAVGGFVGLIAPSPTAR